MVALDEAGVCQFYEIFEERCVWYHSYEDECTSTGNVGFFTCLDVFYVNGFYFAIALYRGDYRI